MLRFLTVALSCSSVAAFTLPSAARPNVVMRCDAPEANMGRRAFAGLCHTLSRALRTSCSSHLCASHLRTASIPLLVAMPALADSAPIRKANQDAIGVSRVPIPSKGEGNKGASIPSVKLDTSWQTKTMVIGPDGAAGGSPKGFFDGGEHKDVSSDSKANPEVKWKGA